MKKVVAKIKLQCVGGQANPAPPIGPALGQHGVNIVEFCKQYNARTQKDNGMVIPVEITVFQDRSFTFITKSPPASVLLRKMAGIPKGSGVPNKELVGKVKKSQVKEIAERKMQDMNANDLEMAMKTIMGTARSMGIVVED